MKKTELQILTWPNKILRKKCKRVKTVDERIRSLLEEMRKVMIANKGIGLAANQVGLDIALIVVNFEDRFFKLVNPSIIRKEGSIEIREGCLSFPNLELEIKRAKKIWLSTLDEYGNQLDIEADGILAVIFQHEIDHINGIPFIYKVPFIKRMKIFSKLYKIRG